MALDDSLADGQADAGSFVDVARMQTRKDVEDPLHVLFVEADAVILDQQAALLVAACSTRRTLLTPLSEPAFDLDNRRLVLAVKLQRVADEVL